MSNGDVEVQAAFNRGLRNTNCEAYRIEQAVKAERDRCAKIVYENLLACDRCGSIGILAKIRSGK